MAISRSLMSRQLQANGGIMQVSPRKNYGMGTSIRDYAMSMNDGKGPITRKDYIDIYLFLGYDTGTAGSLGTKHYKSGMGQDDNTAGLASGGIVSREKFGIGSKLKKFVRKIIPNEVADIAVKAAPFVAPFNPALAGAMAGIGSFDQTGSISEGLKRGALTYGGGQLARYAGGAGFQGNPFASGGAFTPSGFTAGFSSPIGTETGLGKFFSNRGTAPVEGVDYITADAEPVKSSIAETFATADSEPVASKVLEQSITADAPAVASQVTKETITKTNPGFVESVVEGFQNKDFSQVGSAVVDQAKKFGKAMFTNKDGSIDKAAVLGALAFTSSYIEAKALAADAGVELTEDEYDELTKAEKKEEYASYLTNFFAGRKDGGRIGLESGTPRAGLATLAGPTGAQKQTGFITRKSDVDILRRIYEEGGNEGLQAYLAENPDLNDKYVINVDVMSDEISIVPNMLHPDNIDMSKVIMIKSGDDGNIIDMSSMFEEKKAEGGRIGFKRGSPEARGEIGILSVDVEAGDDEGEENMEMAAGISFSSAEKSYLFKKLGGAGGASRSYTMPMLYKILNNPGAYPNDARVLKQITIGLGIAKKDGGRVPFAGGSNRVAQLLILRDELLGKGEDVSDIEAELFQLTGKTFRSVGGISNVPTGDVRKNKAGVIERDYRDEGGFVPVGIKERADDVPAMLSKNEFVMTADAVRGIGGGDVEKGSKKLYDTMKKAERVGRA